MRGCSSGRPGRGGQLRRAPSLPHSNACRTVSLAAVCARAAIRRSRAATRTSVESSRRGCRSRWSRCARSWPPRRACPRSGDGRSCSSKTPTGSPNRRPTRCSSRSRSRLVPLRIPPAEAVAGILSRSGVDGDTARWAAAAGQGHVGRSRRLAHDADARARRAEVLAIPASLTSLAACLAAADHLVIAAEAEAAAITVERDAGEAEALQTALGAGGTGKGAAAASRGATAAVRELERRQRSRATRTQRDALDRALVDLAAFYRDVL